MEHVYPGIKAMLAEQTHHVEIGRVALAPRFQRQPHSLMALFRGGLLIAARSGFSILHGLVSYNHFAHSDAVNTTFLSALMPDRPASTPSHVEAASAPRGETEPQPTIETRWAHCC